MSASRLVKNILICILLMAGCMSLQAQTDTSAAKPALARKVFYGLASYYANSFHGKKTASGEIFHQGKMTAACNVLPLGTWIRVTNLRNGKSVIVKTSDRLHPRMKRVVDLSRTAAEKLGYISQGLTRVKVEVIDGK